MSGGARRAMLAKVHIARKALGLDEATYRGVLERVTGQSSSAACRDAQLDSVLREFKRLGWSGATSRTSSARAQVSKIHALWRDMAPLLADPSDAALRRFVVRMTKTPARPGGVSAPEFLVGRDAVVVIEGLKAWRERLQKQKEAA